MADFDFSEFSPDELTLAIWEKYGIETPDCPLETEWCTLCEPGNWELENAIEEWKDTSAMVDDNTPSGQRFGYVGPPPNLDQDTVLVAFVGNSYGGQDLVNIAGDVVYLLHFDEPYPFGKRPQHYLGHATDGRLGHRLDEHAKGSSKARLTQVMRAAGIGFSIVRVWSGDYELEKALKRRHSPKSLCPVCNPPKSS